MVLSGALEMLLTSWQLAGTFQWKMLEEYSPLEGHGKLGEVSTTPGGSQMLQ